MAVAAMMTTAHRLSPRPSLLRPALEALLLAGGSQLRWTCRRSTLVVAPERLEVAPINELGVVNGDCSSLKLSLPWLPLYALF